MVLLASLWADAAWVVLAVIVIGYVVYMSGLMLASGVLMVVAVIVYPFKSLRRAYRVLKATSDEYDHDGYRKVRDSSGYHYERGAGGTPIYPLAGRWPQRRGSFHSEPLWCVTTNFSRNQFWFSKRDGSEFRWLPRALRGLTDFPTPPGDPNGLDADGDGIACES